MNLDFLDRKEWRCAMCGDTLEEACQKRFPELYIKNQVTARSYYEKKQAAYQHERTQERSKLTCSRACGFAYKSWKQNLDSKRSYITDPFTCDKCGGPATGGRLLKQGKKDYKICRKCARRRAQDRMRAIWFANHKQERREYMKEYRKRKRENAVTSNP
jgi:hypothetical protein